MVPGDGGGGKARAPKTDPKGAMGSRQLTKDQRAAVDEKELRCCRRELDAANRRDTAQGLAFLHVLRLLHGLDVQIAHCGGGGGGGGGGRVRKVWISEWMWFWESGDVDVRYGSLTRVDSV